MGYCGWPIQMSGRGDKSSMEALRPVFIREPLVSSASPLLLSLLLLSLSEGVFFSENEMTVASRRLFNSFIFFRAVGREEIVCMQVTLPA